MYATSNEYQAAIRASGLETSAHGTCAGISFTDANILEGSFSITGQCSGNDLVSIGQVYISELNITLRDLGISKYTYRNSEIIPYFDIETSNGTESVPLGQFTIAEASHTAAGVVIKAYDHMAKLDKSCTITSTAGTPYQLATLACQSCGLSLATSSSDFSAFANGTVTLTLYTDQNDISTWRDFISWVAQSCACNVMADRNGGIVFREYSSTSVDTFDTDHRFLGGSFSDFESYYTGIYVTSITDSTTKYINITPDDGLTYNLGINPFFQYGLEETIKQYCRNVLQSMTAIKYVPFKIETVDDPSYDLMDVFSMPNGIGDSTKLFCMTKFTWSYHDKLTMEGVGADPALANAQSKTDKALKALLSSTDEDAMHFYAYTNAAEYVIRDGNTAEILRIDYVTKKDAHVDFRAEIQLTSDTTESTDTDVYYENDTVAMIEYWLNDSMVDYRPLATFTDGTYLEHLIYWWNSSASVIGNFRVKLTALGGDITIYVGDLNALMYGEGLVGETEDTNPVFTDNVTAFEFYPMLGEFTDTATTSLQTPQSKSLSDTLSAFAFYPAFGSFTDTASMLLGMRFTPYMSVVYLNDFSVSEDDDTWVATDDNQYIITENIYNPAGFTSATGGALSYQMSIDDGATWGSWDGSSITANDEMTYAVIHAISTWPSKAMFKIIFDNGETLKSFMVEGGSIVE